MRDLRRSIEQLETRRRIAIETLHDMDKGHDRESRLIYVEKLADLEAIETALDDKRDILSRAALLPTTGARLRVALGSVVDLIDQHGRLFRYTLVSSVEADPSDGRISIDSPLGSSLLGKTATDTVELCIGQRGQCFRLVGIG